MLKNIFLVFCISYFITACGDSNSLDNNHKTIDQEENSKQAFNIPNIESKHIMPVRELED